MPKPSSLAVEVAVFLKKNPEIKPSRFGRLVNGDPSLVLDLMRGRSCHERTAARIRKFIKGHAK